jgi:hypothetical protein
MATDNRKTRVEDSRSVHDRDAEIRQRLQMDYPDDFYIDLSKKPHDVDYLRIRVSCLGQPDPHRMPTMAMKGWTPVPAERHPELLANSQGFCEHKGLILCERPKAYSQIEWESHHRRALQTMKSIPGQERFMDDPTMPIHTFNNETMLEQQIDARSFPE